TNENASLVAEIVRALDGLPLAIELAAARMSIVGEAQLLELLSRRLDLISARDGRRTTTLRGVLEGSWDALSPEQRQALEACAVFVGGFSLEAFEAVALGNPAGATAPASSLRTEAIEVISALHDRSLVMVVPAPGLPGEVRYGLLESVREYARDR